MGDAWSRCVYGAPIPPDSELSFSVTVQHRLAGWLFVKGDGGLACMSVEDGFAKVEHELASLRHVLSVELVQLVPFDYEVRATLSEWDWNTWQHIHDVVDELARDHVREATLSADVSVQESSAAFSA